jgi:Uncharacterised nucleotidyltransferase/Coenzyme PQQ synthesis protein D (PqqD)
VSPGDQTTPKAAPSAAGVEVDGESVLLDRSTGSLHMLNDVGAAIWSRLDGSRTVDTLVAELSEVFEVDSDRVARDVHEFLAQLAQLGLLEGSTATGELDLATTETDPKSWSLDTVWVDWYTAQVVHALRVRGVEPLLLKGPAIRRWLYPDAPGERGYLDADLLVPAAGLRSAEAVLAQLGFEREDENGVAEVYPWAVSWRRRADGAVVDLHRTLQGCEYAPADPWPALRATAVEEEIGGTQILVPSIAARALQIVLVSPADRPWRRWDDLGRVLERLSAGDWRDAASLARALGVERKFGYRLSQSAAGPEFADRLGVPSAPRWWLRWDADPALRWAAWLVELPSWRARVRLVRQLVRPSAGYSAVGWAAHVLRLAPGAVATLLRRPRREAQASRSQLRS